MQNITKKRFLEAVALMVLPLAAYGASSEAISDTNATPQPEATQETTKLQNPSHCFFEDIAQIMAAMEKKLQMKEDFKNRFKLFENEDNFTLQISNVAPNKNCTTKITHGNPALGELLELSLGNLTILLNACGPVGSIYAKSTSSEEATGKNCTQYSSCSFSSIHNLGERGVKLAETNFTYDEKSKTLSLGMPKAQAIEPVVIEKNLSTIINPNLIAEVDTNAGA